MRKEKSGQYDFVILSLVMLTIGIYGCLPIDNSSNIIQLSYALSHIEIRMLASSMGVN